MWPVPTTPESALRLRGARVAVADHGLLRRDFPGLPAGPAELDRWLTAHGAVISRAQAGQAVTNTPIETAPGEVTALRPAGSGRALLLPLGDGGTAAGFLDVKGAGVAPGVVPSLLTHRNGLLPLAEALREFLVQRLLDAVFAHAEAPYRTVPCYAVLALDFDVKDADGGRAPAGLLLRQAHTRPRRRFGLKEFGSAEAAAELAVERLLRRYGVTSAGRLTTLTVERRGEAISVHYGETELAYPPDELVRIAESAGVTEGTHFFEGANVQFTAEVDAVPPAVHVVDFGGFRVKERFDNPIVSLVSDRPFRMGAVIRPGDAAFVQPDADIRVPFEPWGGQGGVLGWTAADTGLPAFAGDNSRLLMHALAAAFRSGRLTPGQLRATLDVYLGTATARRGSP